MPLNDDPNALTDEEYAALMADMETRAEPCPVAVPPSVVTEALARLDNEDHSG